MKGALQRRWGGAHNHCNSLKDDICGFMTIAGVITRIIYPIISSNCLILSVMMMVGGGRRARRAAGSENTDTHPRNTCASTSSALKPTADGWRQRRDKRPSPQRHIRTVRSHFHTKAVSKMTTTTTSSFQQTKPLEEDMNNDIFYQVSVFQCGVISSSTLSEQPDSGFTRLHIKRLRLILLHDQRTAPGRRHGSLSSWPSAEVRCVCVSAQRLQR